MTPAAICRVRDPHLVVCPSPRLQLLSSALPGGEAYLSIAQHGIDMDLVPLRGQLHR